MLKETKSKLLMLLIAIIIPLLILTLGIIFNFGGIILLIGVLVWIGTTLVIFLPFFG